MLCIKDLPKLTFFELTKLDSQTKSYSIFPMLIKQIKSWGEKNFPQGLVKLQQLGLWILIDNLKKFIFLSLKLPSFIHFSASRFWLVSLFLLTHKIPKRNSIKCSIYSFQHILIRLERDDSSFLGMSE